MVAAYAGLQARYFVPGCPETDTATYLTIAERLVQGQPQTLQNHDPLLYQAHSWLENDRGETVPKYAPGYPLVLALGLLASGETAAYAMNPLLGALALVGAWLLFRFWMGAVAAVLAVLALASCPLFIFFTNYPLAHAADLFCVTWGLYFLWRWMVRGGLASAVLAALALGFAHLVRPQEAVLALPVALAAVQVAKERGRTRGTRAETIALFAVYAGLAAVHMAYNTRMFGHPFTTGYGLSGEQTAFSLANFIHNAPYAFTILTGLGLSLYFGLGLVALLATPSRRDAALLWAWILPTLVVGVSYYWAPRVNNAGYGRFFLSVFPAFIGLSFALLDRLSLPPWRRFLLLGLVCGGVFAVRLPEMMFYARTSGRDWMRVQRQGADLAIRSLREGAVIFADRPPAIHIGGNGFVLYDLSAFQAGWCNELLSPAVPYAVKYQPSCEKRLKDFYAANGNQLDLALRERVQMHVEAGRQVAFLTQSSRKARQAAALGSGFAFTPLADMTAWGGARWELCEVAPVRTPSSRGRPEE